MSTEPSSADQLRRTIDLLWGEVERPSRGPRPSLNLDQIVAAAIAVADAGGIEALSMRRVAAELGAGTMSLYRYVPGKPELLALMLDKLSDPAKELGEAVGKPWREVLELVARCAYRGYLDHPWLLQVNWTRPVLGPNSLAGVEMIIGCLDGLGLSDQERVSMMVMIDGYVTGAARARIQYEAAAAESELTDDEFWACQVPALEKAMQTGEYPAMAGLSEDAFEVGWEESFEFGLQRLLDGAAALIEQRRTEPAPRSRRGCEGGKDGDRGTPSTS